MTSETPIVCPMCLTPRTGSLYHPKAICQSCLTFSPPLNRYGQLVTFQNIDIWGGFVSIANDIQGSDHLCFVNGVKCDAHESRYGGIVIEQVDEIPEQRVIYGIDDDEFYTVTLSTL